MSETNNDDSIDAIHPVCGNLEDKSSNLKKDLSQDKDKKEVAPAIKEQKGVKKRQTTNSRLLKHQNNCCHNFLQRYPHTLEYITIFIALLNLF